MDVAKVVVVGLSELEVETGLEVVGGVSVVVEVGDDVVDTSNDVVVPPASSGPQAINIKANIETSLRITAKLTNRRSEPERLESGAGMRYESGQ